MTASTSTSSPGRPGGLFDLGGQVSLPAVALFLLAFLLMYAGTYAELARTTWATEEQGHGPLILGASAWLLWSKRREIFSGQAQPALAPGFTLLALSLAGYVVARSQGVIEIETASQITMLMAGFLLLHGTGALRRAWFPLFFLLFMVPLPEALVASITGPLKSAVSAVASELLHGLGYPVGRSGVVLTVGQYQLLVADACAGMRTLFMLEAMGIFYLNVVRHTSLLRNVVLGILIVPISFIANMMRVLFLALITYHFGDEVGQGFLHGFAGIVLFVIALVLTISIDGLLRIIAERRQAARGTPKGATA